MKKEYTLVIPIIGLVLGVIGLIISRIELKEIKNQMRMAEELQFPDLMSEYFASFGR